MTERITCICGAEIEAVIDSPPSAGKFWKRIGTSEVCFNGHWHEPAAGCASEPSAAAPEAPHLVKNKNTPESKAFWDHVEAIAAQTVPLPEDLKAIHLACKFEHRELAGPFGAELIERIARAEATIAELRAVMDDVATFAVGNGGDCEIIADRLYAAIARATGKES